MNTPLELIVEEQDLVRHLADAQANVLAARAAYSQCVTVVADLEQDIALTEQEKAYWQRAREQPAKHGTNKTAAARSYYAKGRDLRKLRADMRYALLAEKKALKATTMYEKAQAALYRAQVRNQRMQVQAGLIAKPKRKESVPALVELAQYSGMLDGGW